ncbi:MAG: ankyrin repeat domain-containing protein [Acidobacteriota bacterium]|nr:ankyrin repeat domain-containing protein [Acidobacteriota bacterium]
MSAIISGDSAAARDLLAKGADLNVKDMAGLTALMWAAGNGHLDIVRAYSSPRRT